MPEKTEMKLFLSGGPRAPQQCRGHTLGGVRDTQGLESACPQSTNSNSFTMKEWHSETSGPCWESHSTWALVALRDIRASLGATQHTGIGGHQRTGLSASTAQDSMGEFPDPNPTLADPTV